MSELTSIITDRDDNVRKWGIVAVGIAHPKAAFPVLPEAWFDAATHEPKIPTGIKFIGHLTTEGANVSSSIDSDKTTMNNSLDPVRSDVTGREQSIKFTAGEANAFIQAINHGIPFEDWPESAQGAWGFTDGALAGLPEYRVVLLGQDGVGDQAIYRVKAGFRAKRSDAGDRALSRADTESTEFTFDLLRDVELGLSMLRAQDGPAYHQAASGGSGE
jgi:hypothetical protein